MRHDWKNEVIDGQREALKGRLGMSKKRAETAVPAGAMVQTAPKMELELGDGNGVVTFSLDEFQRLLERDGWNLETTVPLKDGQGISGVFLGSGPNLELAPDSNGEIKYLKTWRIQTSPRTVANVIGAHQLNNALSAIPLNTEVGILRYGQVDTRHGHRVNQYLVMRKDAKSND